MKRDSRSSSCCRKKVVHPLLHISSVLDIYLQQIQCWKQAIARQEISCSSFSWSSRIPDMDLAKVKASHHNTVRSSRDTCSLHSNSKQRLPDVIYTITQKIQRPIQILHMLLALWIFMYKYEEIQLDGKIVRIDLH